MTINFIAINSIFSHLLFRFLHEIFCTVGVAEFNVISSHFK